MLKHILALDLGKGSLGLAISRTGLFVTLLPEIRFHAGEYQETFSTLKKIVAEENVELFVIGYPSYPSGDPCEMSSIVLKYISLLKIEFPKIEVAQVDERYSTVEASEILHRNNVNSKRQKEYIDSAAAAVILERFLESNKK